MTRRFILAAVLVVFATRGSLLFGEETPKAQIRDLKERVQQLEQRVKELEQLVQPLKAELQAKAQKGTLREQFEARMAEDRKTYSQEQLKEIESLYQIANKQRNTPPAQASLKALIEKYPKANRTGCAVLYLGQMSQGEEKEKYLQQAIQEFGDCRYGDGVQVGSFARFLLATHYQQNGKAAEASALWDELRNNFPEAVDHNGKPLVNSIPK